MGNQNYSRRRVLCASGSLLVGSIAGCTGEAEQEERSPTGTEGRSPKGTSTHTASNGGRDTSTLSDLPSETPRPPPTQPGEPFETPFRFDVEVVTPEPTPDSPPIVRITVTNGDDEPHSLMIADQKFPFGSNLGTRPAAGLVLVTELADWEDREGACWTGEPRALPTENGEQFDPGESASVRRAVMNREESQTNSGSQTGSPNTCWPRGTFLFTQHYTLGHPDPDIPERGEFEWGFWVRVTDAPAIQVGKIQPFQN